MMTLADLRAIKKRMDEETTTIYCHPDDKQRVTNRIICGLPVGTIPIECYDVVNGIKTDDQIQRGQVIVVKGTNYDVQIQYRLMEDVDGGCRWLTWATHQH